MKTFAEQTAPVIEHYREQGRFAEVDGDARDEAVTRASAPHCTVCGAEATET